MGMLLCAYPVSLSYNGEKNELETLVLRCFTLKSPFPVSNLCHFQGMAALRGFLCTQVYCQWRSLKLKWQSESQWLRWGLKLIPTQGKSTSTITLQNGLQRSWHKLCAAPHWRCASAKKIGGLIKLALGGGHLCCLIIFERTSFLLPVFIYQLLSNQLEDVGSWLDDGN